MLRLKQARNQLMISGEAKCFLKRPKIFQLCPIVLDLDYVQHIFSGGGEKLFKGVFALPARPWLRSWSEAAQMNK